MRDFPKVVELAGVPLKMALSVGKNTYPTDFNLLVEELVMSEKYTRIIVNEGRRVTAEIKKAENTFFYNKSMGYTCRESVIHQINEFMTLMISFQKMCVYHTSVLVMGRIYYKGWLNKIETPTHIQILLDVLEQLCMANDFCIRLALDGNDLIVDFRNTSLDSNIDRHTYGPMISAIMFLVETAYLFLKDETINKILEGMSIYKKWDYYKFYKDLGEQIILVLTHYISKMNNDISLSHIMYTFVGIRYIFSKLTHYFIGYINEPLLSNGVATSFSLSDRSIVKEVINVMEKFDLKKYLESVSVIINHNVPLDKFGEIDDMVRKAVYPNGF